MAAPGNYCDVDVAFEPYVPAEAFLKFGAMFQNAEGTGISHPMTIAFSPAVSEVTVTAFDPTFDGNTMQAFDGAASIGIASFPGNQRPGIFSTQTRTLRGHITRLVLTPAAAEYIAYSMTVVTTPPPTLAVECSPKALTRGDTVRCVASVSDGSAPGATTWHFESTDPIQPDFVADGTSGAQWEGAVLLSGKISAMATIAGRAETAFTSITVAPRNWSTKAVAVTIDTIPTPFDDPPDSVQQLGSNRPFVRLLIDRYQSVEDGPNAGLAYFTDLPYALHFAVNFNTKALNTSSLFYKMQWTSLHPVAGKPPYCGKKSVIDDIPMIKAHEGFAATDVDSHTDVFTRTFLAIVRAGAEKLIRVPNRLEAETLGDSAFDVAHKQSHLITDSLSNPYHTNCVFNYDKTMKVK